MHIWIGVENFAKIESAKVCINNYTILVGPNNSGKTFLMQLVQGINNKLAYLVDGTLMNSLLVNETEGCSEYNITSTNIADIVSHINAKLELEKEKIIKEIFGKDIPIGRLYVDILLEEGTAYSLTFIDLSKKEILKNVIESFEPMPVDFFSKLETGVLCAVRKGNLDESQMETVSLQGIFSNDEVRLFKSVLNEIIESPSLFLPASRTGLLLLYREFFANKTDNELSFNVRENGIVEKKENISNLTKPLYEFLRFLQTYVEGAKETEKFKDELVFFEEYLIEGHISVDKQGSFSYKSKEQDGVVPMYLASSMINEVAPLVLAIMSVNSYNRLIIDEVEASLHPQKQLELVRFLNRLNNKGMQLIVSTHSDTFVSKVNNLYILSEMVKKNGYEILEQFGLEKEDLISPEKLFVYEFVKQSNGKSIVKEIIGNERMGYQFDLFTASALHLYEEATKLGEL